MKNLELPKKLQGSDSGWGSRQLVYFQDKAGALLSRWYRKDGRNVSVVDNMAICTLFAKL